MHLPNSQNRISKRLNKEKQQWRRRYFKRAARQKNRRYYLLLTVCFMGILMYLTAVGYFRNLLLTVKEERTVEYRKEGDIGDTDSLLQELYRITVRLKTGEIIFYHEKTDEP
ncbi:MAG: hypothetical protein RR768_09795 [Clostridium sp.]